MAKPFLFTDRGRASGRTFEPLRGESHENAHEPSPQSTDEDGQIRLEAEEISRCSEGFDNPVGRNAQKGDDKWMRRYRAHFYSTLAIDRMNKLSMPYWYVGSIEKRIIL